MGALVALGLCFKPRATLCFYEVDGIQVFLVEFTERHRTLDYSGQKKYFIQQKLAK
jgi:hypothetical protein